MTTGAMIRHYRKAAGMSTIDLANRTGLAKSVLSMIERDRTTEPRNDSLGRIARALGLASADELRPGHCRHRTIGWAPQEETGLVICTACGQVIGHLQRDAA